MSGLVLLAIASSIYWMALGWRAMRAHERLAYAIERIADHQIAPIARPVREQDR